MNIMKLNSGPIDCHNIELLMGGIRQAFLTGSKTQPNA